MNAALTSKMQDRLKDLLFQEKVMQQVIIDQMANLVKVQNEIDMLKIMIAYKKKEGETNGVF